MRAMTHKNKMSSFFTKINKNNNYSGNGLKMKKWYEISGNEQT